MFELRWATTQYFVTEINTHCCEHVVEGRLPSHIKKKKRLQYRTKTKIPLHRHTFSNNELDWTEWKDVPEVVIHD